MKFTGPVYRPPYEANSLLLQVTVGCAHNKCTHCSMYKDTKFAIEQIDQIEKDLREAKKVNGNARRIFLVNGDAFVLSAKKLKSIAQLIIKYLPKVEVISMYASINNIKGKTNEQLRELRNLRINELWMGIEAGSRETFKYMNKGFSLEGIYEKLNRLNIEGILHIDNFILGGAGGGKGI